MEFGIHFNDILMIWAYFLGLFLRQCRRCLPISCFPSLCFKWPVSLGCGGDALRLQSAAPSALGVMRRCFEGFNPPSYPPPRPQRHRRTPTNNFQTARKGRFKGASKSSKTWKCLVKGTSKDQKSENVSLKAPPKAKNVEMSR